MGAQAKCKLHPRYRAILTPRSNKPGCICWQIWREKHPPVDWASLEEEIR